MPSPKDGTLSTCVDPLLPKDAVDAIDDQAGDISDAQPRTNTPSGAVKPPVLALPPKPPPLRPLSASAPPVPVAKSPKACGIASLNIACAHGKQRTPGPGPILQIVADNDKRNIQYSVTYLVVTLSGKYGWGGSDGIIATVVPNAGSGGRKQTALLQQFGAPADGDWVDGSPHTWQVKAPGANDFWPIHINPDQYYIYGRGCDDTSRSCLIESYPSEQFSLELDVTSIEKFIEDLEKALNPVIKDSFGPLTVVPEVVSPTGTLTLDCGWQENSDWRVYYLVKISAGLSPLFGYSITFELSLANIAINAGLGSLGIPPVISDLAAHVVTDWMADVFVSLKLEANVSLVGEIAAKFYSTGEVEGSTQITPGVEGFVQVGLTARLGSKYFLNLEITGNAQIGLSLEGDFEVTAEGAFMGPNLKCPGVTVQVICAEKAGDVELTDQTASWQPMPELELWHPDPIQFAGKKGEA